MQFAVAERAAKVCRPQRSGQSDRGQSDDGSRHGARNRRSLAEAEERGQCKAGNRDEEDDGDDAGELMCVDRAIVEPRFSRKSVCRDKTADADR
jgi:hypothetical protein